MVERITDPHHPVSLRHSCHRIPDGHIVPNPPRPETEPTSVSVGITVRSAATRLAWAVVRALS